MILKYHSDENVPFQFGKLFGLHLRQFLLHLLFFIVRRVFLILFSGSLFLAFLLVNIAIVVTWAKPMIKYVVTNRILIYDMWILWCDRDVPHFLVQLLGFLLKFFSQELPQLGSPWQQQTNNTTANQISVTNTEFPYMVDTCRDSPQFLSAQDFNIGAALFDFWWRDGMGFQLGVIKGYLEENRRKLEVETHDRHSHWCLALNWNGLKSYLIGFAQEINRVFSFNKFSHWEGVI